MAVAKFTFPIAKHRSRSSQVPTVSDNQLDFRTADVRGILLGASEGVSTLTIAQRAAIVHVSDLTLDEIALTGYTRPTFSLTSISINPTTGNVEFKYGAGVAGSIGPDVADNIRGLVVYEHLGASDSVNFPIAAVIEQEGFPATSNSQTFTYTPAADGLFRDLV